MTGRIRPLVFGYICEDALLGEEPLASAETRLEDFAYAEGFTLGTIFIERRHSVPWAFDALMQEIRRGDVAWGIVIPDVGHLNDANHRAMSASQEDYTSMTVLVANANVSSRLP
jgi:hypothetical protein